MRIDGMAWALLGLGACCSADPELPPWERDAGARPDARVTTVADGAVAFTPLSAQVELGERRNSLRLSGTTLAVEGSARAWLETDLDGDDDDDALVVIEDAPSDGAAPKLQLASYRRDGADLVAAGGEPIPAPLGEGCALDDLRLGLEAPGALTLAVRTRCAGTPRTFVAQAGGLPARFRLQAAGEGRANRLGMAASDQDTDGRVDAVLSIELDGARAELVYLDRTAGLSIDPATPERSLAPLVPGRRAPDAIVRAAALVELRGLLCTGSIDGGRLTIGDRAAHECAASRATGRAISALVRALVEANRLPEARAALGKLQMEGIALGEEGRMELERAIEAHTGLRLEATHATGPTAALAASPPVRHPLRFLDDDRIAVASSAPFVYFVSSGESMPAERYDDRVLSPDGRSVVWRLDRSCAGHRAVLCPADAPCPEGTPSAIVIARDGLPRSAAGCGQGGGEAPSLPARAGLDVLGWRAPGGLVVLDGIRLREVGVSDAGRALGAPHDLASPSELPPGAPVGAGGRRQAVGAREGLWIRDGDQWALLAAATVGGGWDEVRAIAMSPSGDAVVGVRGGRLEVVRLGAPSASP